MPGAAEELITRSWIEPGMQVLSKSVGRKQAFIGTVIRPHAGSWPVYKSGRAWVVRCHKGFHWHRTTDELRPYEDIPGAAPGNRTPDLPERSRPWTPRRRSYQTPQNH